jgi:hypothetical protein
MEGRVSGSKQTGARKWQLRTPLPDLPLHEPKLRIDAYLVWDELTDYARHGGVRAPLTHMPVLLEFAVGPSSPSAASLQTHLDEWCKLPTVLKLRAGRQLRAALSASLAWAGDSAIHTALLDRRLLPCLHEALRAGVLMRFTLGALCVFRSGPTAAEITKPKATGLLNTLGVIDDGCCFAHQDFRSAGGVRNRSRVLALWDQNPANVVTSTLPWQRYSDGPAPLPYGVEMRLAGIDQVLAAHPELGENEERACYAAIGRPTWGQRDHTHGARVMHLLAGPAIPDVASMPLVFVQLPPQTVADTSGDSLGVHVVDGARYIAARTRECAADDAKWSTTINVSLGSIAGPHDGTSMAELALRDLAAREQVSVVVAAGNTANDQRIHATQHVSKTSSGKFLVRVPPDCTRDSFVELWLPAGELKDFSIQVTAPDGSEFGRPLKVGQMASLPASPGTRAAVIFPQQVAQGNEGTLVLLCIAPTADTAEARQQGKGRVLAEAGIWTLHIASRNDQVALVHAWIERDDIIIGKRKRQQTRFEFHSSLLPRSGGISDEMTLASLANPSLGSRVVVAGGYTQANAAPFTIANYSGMGPLRGNKQGAPDYAFAPSERSSTLSGVATPGFFSGSRATINGTSAAAPQVARLRAVLRQSRKPPVPPADPSTLRRKADDPRPSPEAFDLVPPLGVLPQRARGQNQVK